MQPSPDEFIQWRDHPVTQWVFGLVEKYADKQKAAWVEQSWEGNSPDPLALAELRTRADAYRALTETSFEAWQEVDDAE